MTAQKNQLMDTENRINDLLAFLTDRGHPLPLPLLKEGIARYEGALDWKAFETQLQAVPEQPKPGPARLSLAERDALKEVFADWDRSKSFQAILAELHPSAYVPDSYARKPEYCAASGTRLGHVLEELVKKYEDLRLVEFRALETCLISWSALSYEEVLHVLDSGDEEMMRDYLQVWESQSEMTLAELAAKIRSEYRHFRTYMPS